MCSHTLKKSSKPFAKSSGTSCFNLSQNVCWYEQGQGKPKWKTSMMSMDVIHVHVKKGEEHGKVKSNTRLAEVLSFVTKKSMIKCPKKLIINYNNMILFQIL
jgi:hypothetical protein